MRLLGRVFAGLDRLLFAGPRIFLRRRRNVIQNALAGIADHDLLAFLHVLVNLRAQDDAAH